MIVRHSAAVPVLRLNDDFINVFGFTEDELGRASLLSWIHPEDTSALQDILAIGDGQTRARHKTKSGSWDYLRWTVKTHDGIVVVLGIHDEHPDQNIENSYDETVIPRQTLAHTLEAMVHIVESKNPGLRCSILLLASDQEHVSVGAGPSLPDEYNAAVEGLRIGPTVGSCGTAAFWKFPVVVKNIAEDPLWKDLRDAAAIADVACCWSVPVTSTNNKVLGAMALYDVKPAAPTRHQLDILETSARMVGLAIERDRLELQLREATKTEALGVLAGGIAHDFNNLLAAVIGNAELAMTRAPEDTLLRHNLDQIINASVSATDLCSQMLAFTGRGIGTTESFNCNEMTQQTGELLQAAFSKKVHFQYQLYESALGVIADKSQLRQVLVNLMTNAAESYGNDTGTVSVITGLKTYSHKQLNQLYPNMALKPQQYVRIEIIDDGVGMDPKHLSKIFDPFFTSKPTGRGLGLAAVQGIVRAHCGGISAESKLGQGTRFSIILPHHPLEPQDQVSKKTPVNVVKSARILIGEDEPLVREILVTALADTGYEVVEAADGQEVIDVFLTESDSIDCVLLDFNMPKLNGEEVFTELKKIKSDVRVILCSGFTESEILERFEGAGIAGFIKKPARIKVLIEKIADVLGEK